MVDHEEQDVDDRRTQASSVSVSGSDLWLNPDNMGPELEDLLAAEQIDWRYNESYSDEWWEGYDNRDCVAEGEDYSTFAPFKIERSWLHGHRDFSETCSSPVCDFDPDISDPDKCAEKRSCDRSCLYCKSPPAFTDRQGVCHLEGATENECIGQGGRMVTGPIVHRKTGRFEKNVTACVLPYHAETFCTGPSRRMRYCSDFHYSACEEDVIAKAIGCQVEVNNCRTPPIAKLPATARARMSCSTGQNPTPASFLQLTLNAWASALITYVFKGPCRRLVWRWYRGYIS